MALAHAPLRPKSSGESPPPTTPAPSRAGSVLMRGLQVPIVWLGPGGLYVVTTSRGSPYEDTIRLVGPTTGRVEAREQLPGLVVNWSHFVLSAGNLWVVIERPNSKSSFTDDLLALGAADLHVRHRLVLPQPAELGLAAAGGWVWVEGARDLLKVASGTGRLESTVALPAPSSGDLASDRTGTVLASVHFGDVLDLLNPSTGAVLAHYQGEQGDGAEIAGIADGQVFTETGIGHGSSVQRFDIGDRKFHQVYGWGYSPRLVVSGDRFLFNVYAGYGARAKAPNYCGLAATGQPLATLPDQATPPEGSAVGYARGTLYYLTASGTTYDLDRVGLPGCR
jgi:hypothetical protein